MGEGIAVRRSLQGARDAAEVVCEESRRGQCMRRSVCEIFRSGQHPMRIARRPRHFGPVLVRLCGLGTTWHWRRREVLSRVGCLNRARPVRMGEVSRHRQQSVPRGRQLCGCIGGLRIKHKSDDERVWLSTPAFLWALSGCCPLCWLTERDL
jgi:hypothetical protein